MSLTAPPQIVAIALGLAMDYELFILARMREARRLTGDDEEAVVTGLRHSGRVVTCAALLPAARWAPKVSRRTHDRFGLREEAPVERELASRCIGASVHR